MMIRLCLLASLLLVGCGQPQADLHSPGEYSGEQDPLLEISGTTALREQLQDRISMVQTDR